MQPNDTAPRKRAPRRPPVTVACEVCGTPFTTWPSYVDAGRGRFCGPGCFAESRRRGERRDCEQCGTEFYAKPNHIARGNGRYCGKPCFDEAQRNVPIEDRFWPRVDKTDGCWLWTGALNTNGYGTIYRHYPEHVQAHRLAWELATGETLTPDDAICHTCDVKNCVRNDDESVYQAGDLVFPRRGHLFKGDVPANNADMAAKGRAGWHQTENRRRGEAQNLAKLTVAQVKWIRAQDAAGMRQQDIADLLGVHLSTISNVIRRLTWKHVD